MKDDTLIVPIPTECAVAYLSSKQIDAYGGIEQAKLSLGCDYIACPSLFAEQTIGWAPWFCEAGHA